MRESAFQLDINPNSKWLSACIYLIDFVDLCIDSWLVDGIACSMYIHDTRIFKKNTKTYKDQSVYRNSTLSVTLNLFLSFYLQLIYFAHISCAYLCLSDALEAHWWRHFRYRLLLWHLEWFSLPRFNGDVSS